MDIKLGSSAESFMAYTLSSNPPNPRASFRLGDWLCPRPACAAHNFGRNQACIACRRPPTMPNPDLVYSSAPPLWPAPSPPLDLTRLAALPKPPPPKPLLTPSGRAFAVGGRVQNVSSDPLAPCIMYWPDNEPFPEQGQIRPSNVVGVAPPILNTGNRGPISHQPGDWVCQKCNYLNWRRRKVCQTCLPYAEGNGDSISAAVQAERIALLTQVLSQNSVPPPQQQLPPPQHQHHHQPTPRSHSMTPPQVRSRVPHLSTGDHISGALGTHAQGFGGSGNGLNSARTIQRSRSQLSLGSQQPPFSPSPIYQTGVRPARATTLSVGQIQHQHQLQQQQQELQRLQQRHLQPLSTTRREPSPLYSTGPLPGAYTYRTSPTPSSSAITTPGPSATPHNVSHEYYNSNTISVHAPAPLLPSFLQDMVQTPPSLSPASNASSSSISFEEEDHLHHPLARDGRRPRVSSGSTDSSGSGLGNIWKMDGAETKGLVPMYAAGVTGAKDVSPFGVGVIGMGRLR